MMSDHEARMREAIAEANRALAIDEVPIGCIVIHEPTARIIGRGHNRRENDRDPTAHAEMVAIRHAATRIGQSRLDGCTLWVTLEPCAMCAAAIAISRIDALRFAAEDPKGGGVVNGPRFFSQPTCHHSPDVLGGIGEEEAAAQLRAFFEARRT